MFCPRQYNLQLLECQETSAISEIQMTAAELEIQILFEGNPKSQILQPSQSYLSALLNSIVIGSIFQILRKWIKNHARLTHPKYVFLKMVWVILHVPNFQIYTRKCFLLSIYILHQIQFMERYILVFIAQLLHKIIKSFYKKDFYIHTKRTQMITLCGDVVHITTMTLVHF